MGRLGARAGRTASGGDLPGQGVMPPWTETGAGTGALDRRRSAHTPTRSRALSGTAYRADYDRAGLSLPERHGRSVPPAPPGRRAALSGTTQPPAADR